MHIKQYYIVVEKVVTWLWLWWLWRSKRERTQSECSEVGKDKTETEDKGRGGLSWGWTNKQRVLFGGNDELKSKPHVVPFLF